MKFLKSLFIILVSLFVLSSCDSSYLDEGPNNTPIDNFELLWKDFDEHYALFGVKNISWDSLYAVYRPQIDENTTDEALWNIMTEMLNQLDDDHVKITNNAGEVFESSLTNNPHVYEEFSINMIVNELLVENTRVQPDVNMIYGKLKDHNIGYMHLIMMMGEKAGTISQDIVAEFADTDAIIVDIRNNIGGMDSYAYDFAKAFSDGGEFVFTVQTKNGPGENDFDKPEKIYSPDPSDIHYSKPVVLLTDRGTVSGAEIFTFFMKSFDHVTHIGDYTSGAHSDVGVVRFLPNGWTYEYSHQLYLTPEGKSLETVGIAPDYYIKNTVQDIENKQDKVLEFAVDYLTNN